LEYTLYDLTKYLDLAKYCQFMENHSIIRIVYREGDVYI